LCLLVFWLLHGCFSSCFFARGFEAFACIAHAGMLPLAKALSFVMPGTAALNKVWPFGVTLLVHRALCKVSIWPSVLRQPAYPIALPAGDSPPLNRAACPAAVSSSLWWIEMPQIVWHSQCTFAFWRFANGFEARRTSLQYREFSLQGFTIQAVPSGKAHWPNSTVKLTPKATLLVPSTLRVPAQLT
jgi:hypothetical protein